MSKISELITEKLSKIKEAKEYNFKADALNDYFKSVLSVKELEEVAKKNFNSEIATKAELKMFMSNKTMQEIMADTYDIKVDELVKKVKDLLNSM